MGIIRAGGYQGGWQSAGRVRAESPLRAVVSEFRGRSGLYIMRVVGPQQNALSRLWTLSTPLPSRGHCPEGEFQEQRSEVRKCNVQGPGAGLFPPHPPRGTAPVDPRQEGTPDRSLSALHINRDLCLYSDFF